MGKIHSGQVVDLCDPEKIKTAAQRNSLHLWLRQVADLLNAAGYDMVLFLETLGAEDTTVSCSMEALKERFWKVLLKHLEGKDSTEQHSTADVNEVYQEACVILSERFGITPPAWPSSRIGPA